MIHVAVVKALPLRDTVHFPDICGIAIYLQITSRKCQVNQLSLAC